MSPTAILEAVAKINIPSPPPENRTTVALIVQPVAQSLHLLSYRFSLTTFKIMRMCNSENYSQNSSTSFLKWT
jgi:hypothetical protein